MKKVSWDGAYLPILNHKLIKQIAEDSDIPDDVDMMRIFSRQYSCLRTHNAAITSSAILSHDGSATLITGFPKALLVYLVAKQYDEIKLAEVDNCILRPMGRHMSAYPTNSPMRLRKIYLCDKHLIDEDASKGLPVKNIIKFEPDPKMGQTSDMELLERTLSGRTARKKYRQSLRRHLSHTFPKALRGNLRIDRRHEGAIKEIVNGYAETCNCYTILTPLICAPGGLKEKYKIENIICDQLKGRKETFSIEPPLFPKKLIDSVHAAITKKK